MFMNGDSYVIASFITAPPDHHGDNLMSTAMARMESSSPLQSLRQACIPADSSSYFR